MENNERLHPYERALPPGAVAVSPHDKASRRRQLAVSTGVVCVLSALLTLIALVAVLYVRLRRAKGILDHLQVRGWCLAVSLEAHAHAQAGLSTPRSSPGLVWT